MEHGSKFISHVLSHILKKFTLQPEKILAADWNNSLWIYIYLRYCLSSCTNLTLLEIIIAFFYVCRGISMGIKGEMFKFLLTIVVWQWIHFMSNRGWIFYRKLLEWHPFSQRMMPLSLLWKRCGFYCICNIIFYSLIIISH